MALRHQIEMWMTVAFALYAVAYGLVKFKFWKLHIVCASLGFATDMYATVLMVRIMSRMEGNLNDVSLMVKIHLFLSLVAIFAFIAQAMLGVKILRKKNLAFRQAAMLDHGRFAVRFFFPIWIISYLSGFALAFV